MYVIDMNVVCFEINRRNELIYILKLRKYT